MNANDGLMVQSVDENDKEDENISIEPYRDQNYWVEEEIKRMGNIIKEQDRKRHV